MESDNFNNYIYHYTKIDTLINYILKNNEIKASQLKNTNDPKEYTRKIFGIGYSGGENEKIDPCKSDIIINRYINLFKIVSFCTGKPDRKGYLKPRMWAQYGSNNEGCCLEFDKKELLKVINEKYIHISKKEEIDKFNMQKYFIEGTITYINTSNNSENSKPVNSKINIEAIEESIVNQVLPDILKTAFEKDEDWCSEDEYRIILKSENDNYEYIKYNNAVVKKIFLGEKVTEDIIFKLLPFCANNDIELYKLVWDRNNYHERKLTMNYILKRDIEAALFKKVIPDMDDFVIKEFGRENWIKFMKVKNGEENRMTEKELVDFLNLIKDRMIKL